MLNSMSYEGSRILLRKVKRRDDKVKIFNIITVLPYNFKGVLFYFVNNDEHKTIIFAVPAAVHVRHLLPRRRAEDVGRGEHGQAESKYERQTHHNPDTPGG